MAMWNMRTLIRAGTLKNLIQELQRYKINLVTVRDIQWKRNDLIVMATLYAMVVVMIGISWEWACWYTRN